MLMKELGPVTLPQNAPSGKPLCAKCGGNSQRKRLGRVHSGRYVQLPDGSNAIKSPIWQRALAEHDACAAVAT
jgi:hypothetical protein